MGSAHAVSGAWAFSRVIGDGEMLPPSPMLRRASQFQPEHRRAVRHTCPAHVPAMKFDTRLLHSQAEIIAVQFPRHWRPTYPDVLRYFL